MKKIFSIILLGIALLSCQQKPGFIISGSLTNAEGKEIVLVKQDGRSTVVIDSIVIINDLFKFTGTVDFPDMHYLQILGTNSKRNIFLENSEITISGDADAIDELVITGSKSEDEYQSYIELLAPIDEKMAVIYQEYPLAQQAGDEARMQELLDEYTVIENDISELGKQFILNNPGSYVSPGIIGHLANNLEANEIEDLLNILHENVVASPIAQELQERVIILKKSAIGQPAPDFELNDVEGNPVKLSDKIGARLLLLDFWAVWCNPCRQENPNVVAVYNQYKDKGFDVFGVSLDKDKEAWLQAIDDDKLTWTHVSQLEGWTCDAVDKYGVVSIPANFLIDENGIIVAKNLRGEGLESKVEELLGE